MDFKERIMKNKNLYKIIAYGISGVITTIISIVSFKIFLDIMDYIFAFSLSWYIAVTFAYISTRKSVYGSTANKSTEKLAEYLRFILGRIITYIINLLLLIISVEVFKFDEFYSNAVITIIVIILNYFVGDIMINKLKLTKKERGK